MGSQDWKLANCRMYERRDMDLAAEETETSSIIRIKKEDQDKRTNTNVNSEKPDTVLYLREINK